MANFSIRAVIGATTAPFQRALSGLNGFVRRTFSGLRGLLAGVFSVALVKGLFDEFDRLAKLARQLRLPASTVQEFSVAAQLGGTNVELLAKSLIDAEKNAIRASQGTESYRKAFDTLGVSAREFLQLDQQGRLAALAGGYTEAGNQAQFLASLQEVLGEEARELIPTLELGADGVRDMLDSINTLDDVEFSQIEFFNDQISLLTNNLKGAAIPTLLLLAETVGVVALRLVQAGAIVLETVKSIIPAIDAFASDGTRGLIRVRDEAFDRMSEILEPTQNAIDKIGELRDQMNQIRSSDRGGPSFGNEESIQAQNSAVERLIELENRFREEREKAEIASLGTEEQINALLEKRRNVVDELNSFNGFTAEEETNRRILALKQQQLEIDRDVQALRTQRQVEREEQKALLNSGRERVSELRQEKEILRLRIQGADAQADALEKNAQATKEAQEFLRSVGVAFEGEVAERAIAEFRELFDLQDQLAEKESVSNERRQAILGSFRNIGANDPIGVALSGPFDKQLEAQRETKRAVEEQTSAVVNAVGEVREAVEGAGIGTVQFARLN